MGAALAQCGWRLLSSDAVVVFDPGLYGALLITLTFTCGAELFQALRNRLYREQIPGAGKLLWPNIEISSEELHAVRVPLSLTFLIMLIAALLRRCAVFSSVWLRRASASCGVTAARARL